MGDKLTPGQLQRQAALTRADNMRLGEKGMSNTKN